MKSSNEFSATALFIKGALEAGLKAGGHTLAEFEGALASGDSTKTAALLEKNAVGVMDALKALVGAGKGGLYLGGGSALLAGGLAGGGLYGGYKGLKDSQRKIDEADAVRQRVELATRELQSAPTGM